MVISMETILTIHWIKRDCAADIFISVDQTLGKEERKQKWIFLYHYDKYAHYARYELYM